MTPPHDLWEKLLSGLGKEGPTKAEERPPFGFATRVARRWAERRQRQLRWLLRERLAVRCAACAVALAMVTFVFTDRADTPSAALFTIPDIDLPNTTPAIK